MTRAVVRVAELPTVLFTFNLEAKVPAVLLIVLSDEPSRERVRLAPPKVPEELKALSPWTMRVMAEAGLESVPAVKVRLPVSVQEEARTIVAVPVSLLIVMPPNVTEPQVKVVLSVPAPSAKVRRRPFGNVPEDTSKLPSTEMVLPEEYVTTPLEPLVNDPPVTQLVPLCVIVPLLVKVW